MTPREERGLVIAATCRLSRKDDGTWLVPSQSCAETVYSVNMATKACTCLDCTEGGFVCKHFYAATFVHKRDILPDGTMIETRQLLFEEKKVYTQDWPAYNLAQSIEKDRVQELLFDLCKGLVEPERPVSTRGQKPHTFKDSIFAMAFKVYCGFSARRFSCDLRVAHERGYLSREVPGMKVNKFMENPALTPILKALVAKSAAPLKAVETDFAIDSSGFSTSKFERWYDQKYGVTKLKCVWVKTHICCGVKTNVVTAVRILDKDAGDSPQFVPLVKETRKTFTIGEVSADKAYASVENFEAVAACGGTGFIAFKKNATGAAGGLFEKMFHYFQFKQDEYMGHYHKRSNVESAFSAIKRKFGDSVRSRDDTAMVNEVLCKLIAHNLCCLIQEQSPRTQNVVLAIRRFRADGPVVCTHKMTLGPFPALARPAGLPWEVSPMSQDRVAQIKAAHVRRQHAEKIREVWRRDRHRELDALPADLPMVVVMTHAACPLNVLEVYRRLIFGNHQRQGS